MSKLFIKWRKAKKVFWFLLFLYLVVPVHGQVNDIVNDSVLQKDPNHAMDRYHETLRHNDPMMYLAFPVIKPIVDRSVPLKDGEGKNGYWAEGHFGNRFVIYQGKYYTNPFFQRMRLTFDVSILARLTQDNSNPLLPNSNKFGFGLDFLLSSIKNLNESRGGMVWTTIQLHHYSNGQADSFFLNTSIKRNNYKSGDFSTNYWKAMINISSNSINKNFIIAGLGYQHEIDLGGPFSSSKELKGFYGDGRFLFHLHWIKNPMLRTMSTVNRGINKPDMIKREVRRHFGIRSEFEFLTGDLSGFEHDNKYRLGWHTYINYMPSVTNEIGFMLHSFVGRDYLNIRFDDVVFIGEAGLYFKFNAQ
jgi:hypothetical protein